MLFSPKLTGTARRCLITAILLSYAHSPKGVNCPDDGSQSDIVRRTEAERTSPGRQLAVKVVHKRGLEI
jgi:hypothetical protein